MTAFHKHDAKPQAGRDEVIHSLDQQSFQALLFNSFVNQQQRKRGNLRTMQRLTGILLLVHEVTKCTDHRRVLHQAADKSVELTGATGAAIAMAEGGNMVCLASSGATAPDLGVPLSQQAGLSAECVRSGQTLICLDTDSDPRVNRAGARSLCARSVVLVPMLRNGSVVGVLEAFAPQLGAFDSEDVVTLEILANVAALALVYYGELQARATLQAERSDIIRVLEKITPALQAAISQPRSLPAASASAAILAAQSLPLSNEDLRSLAETLSFFSNWKPPDGNGGPPR